MHSTNIADSRKHLTRYVEEVRAGEEIVVRDRQLPFAKIVHLRMTTMRRTRCSSRQGCYVEPTARYRRRSGVWVVPRSPETLRRMLSVGIGRMIDDILG